MTSYVLAVPLFAMLVTASGVAAGDSDRFQGVLKLEVTGSCGEPVHEWRIDSFRNVKGQEMKGVFRGGTTRQIPYGRYRIRVLGGAFLPYDGTIAVRKGFTAYLIGLTFAGMDNIPPSFDIRGRFTEPPALGSWCKLSGIYTRDAYFDIVKPDGRFLFPFVPVASYVLLCQHNSDVLTLRRVEMCHGEIEEIVVPAPEAKLPR